MKVVKIVSRTVLFSMALFFAFACQSNGEKVAPTEGIQHLPPEQDTKTQRVENAYNIPRYIKIAKDRFNIDIEKIYLGHNTTGLTAVIVNLSQKISEAELMTLQNALNQVFREYHSATLYTIVNYQQAPYALLMGNRDRYEKENNWNSVYRYDWALKKLKEKADRFKADFSTYKALADHEIVSLHYGLEWTGLPKDRSEFPKALVCFTKDQQGGYHRFKVYDGEIGKLWPYRYEESENRFYSTGQRTDHDIQVELANGDMVSISLYYFEADDERYGSYFLKVE